MTALTGADVRGALADEAARKVLGHFIFKMGGALAHGPASELDAGRRDLARQMFAELRAYAPQQAAALLLESTGGATPKDMKRP